MRFFRLYGTSKSVSLPGMRSMATLCVYAACQNVMSAFHPVPHVRKQLTMDVCRQASSLNSTPVSSRAFQGFHLLVSCAPLRSNDREGRDDAMAFRRSRRSPTRAVAAAATIRSSASSPSCCARPCTGNGRDAGGGCGRVHVRTTGSPFRPSACAPCNGFRAWRRAGLRCARRPPGTWSGRWSPAVGGTRSGP